MTIEALHPEDLLEREATGDLSPIEGERLALHVRHCAVCRLERTLRADFRQADDRGAPALDVHSLLSRALAPGAASALVRREVERSRASAMRRMRPFLLIAAALCVAGASVAAGWQGLPRLRLQRGPEDVNWTIPPRAANERGIAKASTGAAVPSLGPASTESALLGWSADTPPAATRVPKVSSGALATSSRPGPSAASLFAEANAVRRSGDRAAAAEFYRALVDRFPHSAEAHEAQAALGHLLLSDGDAAAALRCFDEYLFASGPLEEDVRVDRAQALAHLHRFGDEAEAWASLLRAHPASVHAERARARLRELGDR